MENARPDCAPGIYEKVLSLIMNEQKGRVLDAPCGEGAFSFQLRREGFQVYAADLDAKRFMLKDVYLVKTDLNQDLPFGDSILDTIICIEGIEHLENPHHLVREFARVLKSNGSLLITTPNTLSVYSRLRYLFFGSPDRLHSEIESFEGSLYDMLRRHINPIGYPELKFMGLLPIEWVKLVMQQPKNRLGKRVW
jgi:SAM-dependent methyltransferase